MKGYAPGWWVRCTHCGWTAPAAETGMIRIGAASIGKRVRASCPQCEQRRWLQVLAGQTEQDLPPFAESNAVGGALETQRRRWLKLAPLIGLPLLLFLGGLFGGIEYYLNQHPLTRQARQLAVDDPRVSEALGPQLQLGWLINGSIRNDEGQLQIPIRGANSSGELHVAGRAASGTWDLKSCRLVWKGEPEGLELVPGPLERPMDTE